MKKLFVVLLVLAFSASFISCKKEDVIQNEKSLVKQQKNGGDIDEVLLQFILEQVEFVRYLAGEDVEKERTVINGQCTYRVFITNDQSELDEWIETESANEKETGTFEVEGLFVGISKKCDDIVLPVDSPYDILRLCSFDFDAFIDGYVEGDDVHIEEEVTDDEGMVCYGIIITNKEGNLKAWAEREKAAGKSVFTFSIGKLHVGISWKEKEKDDE